jgi:hypothetical protein
MSDAVSIPRDAFGYWLSGFVDGEGTFILRSPKVRNRPRPSAEFRIVLRDDDAEIVEAIAAFFGCGFVLRNSNARSKIANAKPIISFSVAAVRSHVSVIIPHFDRYPLLAKKRADFRIWREAVLFMASVQAEPKLHLESPRRGFCPRWSDERLQTFFNFRERLRDARRYVPS